MNDAVNWIKGDPVSFAMRRVREGGVDSWITGVADIQMYAFRGAALANLSLYEFTMWYEKAELPKKKAVTQGVPTPVPRCPLTGKPMGVRLPERVAFMPAHPQAHTHCLRRRTKLPHVPNVFSHRLLATTDIIKDGGADPKMVDSAHRYLAMYRPWSGSSGDTDVPTDAKAIFDDFAAFAVGSAAAPPTCTPFAATLLKNDENEQITRRIARRITAAGDDLEFVRSDKDNDEMLLDNVEDLFIQEGVQMATPLHPTAAKVLGHFNHLANTSAPVTVHRPRFLGCGPQDKCVSCGHTLPITPSTTPASAAPHVSTCKNRTCGLFDVDLYQEQVLEEALKHDVKPFQHLVPPPDSETTDSRDSGSCTPSVSDLVYDLANSVNQLPPDGVDLNALPEIRLLHRASINPTGARLQSQFQSLNHLQHKALIVLAASLLANYATANPGLDQAPELVALANRITRQTGPIQMALLGKGGTGTFPSLYNNLFSLSYNFIVETAHLARFVRCHDRDRVRLSYKTHFILYALPGKTHLLNAFKAYAKSIGLEQHVLFCATTGAAAGLLASTTWHSVLKIPVKGRTYIISQATLSALFLLAFSPLLHYLSFVTCPIASGRARGEFILTEI